MNYGNHASQVYLRNAVMTATQEQLHLMLIDGGIKYATLARQCLEKMDYEGSFNALERAQKIMLELQSGLRRDTNPELVDRMIGLYGFIYRRLVESNFQRSTKPLDDAIHFLREQRQTWSILMDRLAREIPAELHQAAPAQAPALSLQG